MALSLLLNGRGDEPTPAEQYAKMYKLNPEQLLALKKLEPQLTNQYDVALKSPEGAVQFLATLRKAMVNIDEASTPVKINGNTLPASFTDIFFPKKEGPSSDPFERYNSVSKSGFMGLGPDNFVDQYTLSWAGRLIISAPDILMPVLQERAKMFHPTASDYILYASAIEFAYAAAMSEDNGDNLNQVSLSSSAGLLTMAQAKNPIYRLLAAQLLVFLAPKDITLWKFYSAYLNETDPTILASIIEELGPVKNPASLNLLQSLQPAVQKTGDAKLEAYLQEQIKRLKQ
jgi:hypothetical protein